MELTDTFSLDAGQLDFPDCPNPTAARAMTKSILNSINQTPQKERTKRIKAILKDKKGSVVAVENCLRERGEFDLLYAYWVFTFDSDEDRTKTANQVVDAVFEVLEKLHN